jgi:BolA family transcriptional regulator, general stress-responsive regulator
LNVPQLIHERLAVLAPESLTVEDESAQHAGHEGARSGGGHYRLVIVSPQFSGQPLQVRHRMIYQALQPMMQKDIHALAIQAYAPDEI